MMHRLPVIAWMVAGLLTAQASGWAVAEEPQDAVAKALSAANEKLLSWQTADARRALEPVQGQAAADAAVAVALAQVLVQEKKYPDAVQQLEAAAKVAPTDPAVQVALGDAYLLLKRSGEAKGAFERAVTLANAAREKNANDVRAVLYRAMAQQRLKQLEPAAAGLLEVVAAGGSDELTALYELGVTRALQGKWQEAFDTLTKALEKNKGFAYAYYYRGLAAEKLGRKDVLINDMGRFLYLAPNAPEASRAQAILNAAKR